MTIRIYGATGLAMATGWQTIAVIFRQTVGGAIQVETMEQPIRMEAMEQTIRMKTKETTIGTEAMGKIGAGNRRQQSGGRLR